MPHLCFFDNGLSVWVNWSLPQNEGMAALGLTLCGGVVVKGPRQPRVVAAWEAGVTHVPDGYDQICHVAQQRHTELA
jgi:hypothetical protein